jgi:hypothetical protein
MKSKIDDNNIKEIKRWVTEAFIESNERFNKVKQLTNEKINSISELMHSFQ